MASRLKQLDLIPPPPTKADALRLQEYKEDALHQLGRVRHFLRESTRVPKAALPELREAEQELLADQRSTGMPEEMLTATGDTRCS